MREVAQRVVHEPFLASAAFRTVAEVEPLGGLAGILITFARWAWIKNRSRLPAYPFVVVTSDELVVLEFIFATTLRMKRVMGRWRHDQVRLVEASTERRRITLLLPSSRSPVELEGAFGSDAERDVVSQLGALLSKE